MDYDLTPEQLSIKENFTKFCTKEIEPRAQMLDQASHEEVAVLIRENIKMLAGIGYLGIGHEEAYGGMNLDLISQAVAGEAVAAACASTFLSCGASCGLFGVPLKMFGTDAQKEKYLPGIIRGELIGCFGLTEPEAGSDAASIKTTAVKKRDRWVLNGTKTFITNATIADVALIFAYNDREKGPGAGVTCFLVERGTPGFSAGKPFDKMGFRGSPTAELIFDDCELPESAVLGVVGNGFIQAMQTLEYGRIGMATVCLGIAAKCLEHANRYSKERKAFGKPINRFQEISFKLADMAILSDVARLLIYKAAWAKETKNPESAVLASVAKLWASEAATQISSMAVQVFGGYGYMKDFPVERLYRDAKLGEIGEGTSEIQRVLIAKDLIRRYAA
ncbi:MAG: acyl-CoA dehydrogenase family protein [Deltaproteobacteria bacterium]|nr:acyl-CoA dehydrogenase family protein [Deltaproteobacteria bacterium]